MVWIAFIDIYSTAQPPTHGHYVCDLLLRYAVELDALCGDVNVPTGYGVKIGAGRKLFTNRL